MKGGESTNMNNLRVLAEKYNGSAIADEEYIKALARAERKLEIIITREGDCNGERLKPYYLAQLISESVNSERFTTYCFVRSM